jgi:hypothetical protein
LTDSTFSTVVGSRLFWTGSQVGCRTGVGRRAGGRCGGKAESAAESAAAGGRGHVMAVWWRFQKISAVECGWIKEVRPSDRKAEGLARAKYDWKGRRMVKGPDPMMISCSLSRFLYPRMYSPRHPFVLSLAAIRPSGGLRTTAAIWHVWPGSRMPPTPP